MKQKAIDSLEAEFADEELLYVRKLEIPMEWKAAIPDDLLENLSKRDRHVLTTLSIMAQQQAFLSESTIYHNQCLRVNERRLIKIERLVRFILSRWSVLGGLAVLAAPYVLPRIITLIFPAVPHVP